MGVFLHSVQCQYRNLFHIPRSFSNGGRTSLCNHCLLPLCFAEAMLRWETRRSFRIWQQRVTRSVLITPPHDSQGCTSYVAEPTISYQHNGTKSLDSHTFFLHYSTSQRLRLRSSFTAFDRNPAITSIDRGTATKSLQHYGAYSAQTSAAAQQLSLQRRFSEPVRRSS